MDTMIYNASNIGGAYIVQQIMPIDGFKFTCSDNGETANFAGRDQMWTVRVQLMLTKEDVVKNLAFMRYEQGWNIINVSGICPCTDAREYALTEECKYGCKVFKCNNCESERTIHNPTYGCRK